MEGLVGSMNYPDPVFWKNRSIFVTGHTGFKGSWLCLWLMSMGARVHGYALRPPSKPSFYELACLEKNLYSSTVGDVRDLNSLLASIRSARPSVVIHLAAQSLVGKSYLDPIETLATNILGTANLLESVRGVGTVEAVLNVTSDKCYQNNEWIWPYRETDSLGGRDPYSASKAAAELVAEAYKASFLEQQQIRSASARAGNVIGGGDWAANRLIPDFLRAWDERKPLIVRSPNSIRPWQHVLEPLCGYLLLTEKLVAGGAEYSSAWNFGPDDSDAKPVSWILEKLCEKVAGASWLKQEGTDYHEASLLRLDSSKAANRLLWRPRWGVEVAIDKTLEWHQAWRQGDDLAEFSLRQIASYISKSV